MKNLNNTTILFLAIVILLPLGCNKTEDPAIKKVADPVTDVEGNIYETIRVGNQQWMAENLNVRHFRNGDPIPEALTKEEWELAGMEGRPAWCYYNNEASAATSNGKLYNWYAVNDPRRLCPEGWCVANTNAWADLIDYMGGYDIAGIKLKSDTGWDLSGNGDNSSGFNGLPGGGRLPGGAFVDGGQSGIWWTGSEQSANSSYGYNLINANNGIFRGIYDKASGLSVRAIYCPDSSDDSTAALTFYEKLQNVLDNSLENVNGKGVSAAVILPDGEMWLGVSGISHGTSPISLDMLFGTGSMGKMYTATTILQLTDEGLLNLDDPIQKWIETYPNIDGSITIRQLLNHTSGLPNLSDHPEYLKSMLSEPDRYWAPEEIITEFTSEPLFLKGTDWHYSNINYLLLGLIIEEVTGAGIASEFRNRLFDPLDLDGTYFADEEPIPGIIAHGWSDFVGGIFQDISTIPKTAIYSTGWTAGAQFSTAKDLARWAYALFHDKSVISPISLDQMLAFHSPCTGEESLVAGYGLGVTKFQPAVVNNLRAWGHGGDGFGYLAICMYLPDYGVSIGVMENIEGGRSMPSVISGILEIISNHLTKT
jgi:D-alanyl-D-alanine carboxypeptidase